MTSPYIVFRDITFRYPGTAVDVLESVSLDIEHGEFFVLLGPSGCGKTTMLNILAGFEHPTAGGVDVDGQPVERPGRDRIVIFQGDDSLLDWLPVHKNIEFGLSIAGVPAAERAEKIAWALRTVELAGSEHKYPNELSGGMKQRVQIARSLVCDSEILLMDEPFGALDAQTRASLQDELARIWAETRRTVLFITHDISEALILADRIGVMSSGPRAGIATILENDLPRPRNRGTAEFAHMFGRVEQELRRTKSEGPGSSAEAVPAASAGEE